MKIEFPKSHIPRYLFHRLRHFPGQKFTYVENPKVACTALELMLWKRFDEKGAPANPHAPNIVRPFPTELRNFDPALIPELLQSVFFSVVRNPYSRFLSAYLDKVCKKDTWSRVGRSFNYPASEPAPNMDRFIDMTLDSDPFEIDHHFRPQHINLMHGFLPLDYLGHLETLDRVQAFLAKHQLELPNARPHATHASRKVDELVTPERAVKIARYYENDFTLYGYSDDISVKGPVRKPIFGSNRSRLQKFLVRNAEARPKFDKAV